MSVDVKTEALKNAQKILQLLAKTMKIGPYSLCFCGGGKKYKFCCYENSGDKLFFTENAFEKIIKYRDSQGGKISKFPLSLFAEFQKLSLARLPCLYPECDKKPVDCHLVPENILRKNFGSFCNQFRSQDNSPYGTFVKTGVNDAGVLPVFCSHHDSDLFQSVDTLDIDFANEEQLFLLALKAIAFSLRNTQWLLGINSQVELVRPILIVENKNPPIKNGGNIEIDISRLLIQYTRFSIVYDIFRKAVSALNNKNWDFFSFSHRKIQNANKIFFSGFLNPSHDLKGARINEPQTAISITCNVFSSDGQIRALFACPGKVSKNAYQNLLKQINKVDEQTFIAVLNNIFNISAEKPLIPLELIISRQGIEKIQLLDQKSARAINASSDEILDLKNIEQTVQFISL